MSLVAVIVLVVAGIVGIIHQVSVSSAEINATATANADATDSINAIATANVAATSDAGTAILASVIAKDTATATTMHTNPDPYGTGGTLVLLDSLTQEGNWSNSSGACQFMSDGYHITEQQKGINECDANQNFDNVVFEVKMTINRGDCGGMTLRYVYTFYVCSDGTYQFLVSTLASSAILKSGSNSGITAGQNIIAVVASESNFTLYLNHKQLDSVSDGTDGSGPIGLIAGSTNNNSNTTTEVTYRDVRIWTL